MIHSVYGLFFVQIKFLPIKTIINQGNEQQDGKLITKEFSPQLGINYQNGVCCCIVSATTHSSVSAIKTFTNENLSVSSDTSGYSPASSVLSSTGNTWSHGKWPQPLLPFSTFVQEARRKDGSKQPTRTGRKNWVTWGRKSFCRNCFHVSRRRSPSSSLPPVANEHFLLELSPRKLLFQRVCACSGLGWWCAGWGRCSCAF